MQKSSKSTAMYPSKGQSKCFTFHLPRTTLSACPVLALGTLLRAGALLCTAQIHASSRKKNDFIFHKKQMAVNSFPIKSIKLYSGVAFKDKSSMSFIIFQLQSAGFHWWLNYSQSSHKDSKEHKMMHSAHQLAHSLLLLQALSSG